MIYVELFRPFRACESLTGAIRGRCPRLLYVAPSGLSRQCLSFTDAVPDEVRHLDEEEAAVAAEARFEVAGERVDAVAIHVVVVAHVERGSGVRSPAE